MATTKGRNARAAKAAAARKKPAPATKKAPDARGGAKKKPAPATKKSATAKAAAAKKPAPAKKDPVPPKKKAAPPGKKPAPAKKDPVPPKKKAAPPEKRPAPPKKRTAPAAPPPKAPAAPSPKAPAAPPPKAPAAPPPKVKSPARKADTAPRPEQAPPREETAGRDEQAKRPLAKKPPERPTVKVHRPKARMGADGTLILEDDKILLKAYYAGQQMPSPMGGFLQLLGVRSRDDGSAIALLECSASSLRYLMELAKASKAERSQVKAVQERGEDPDCPRHGPGVRLFRAGKDLVCPLCGIAYGRV